MNNNDKPDFWEYFYRTCAITAYIVVVAFIIFILPKLPDASEAINKSKEEAECLKKRCADLERRCDSLQKQTNFIYEQ